MAKFRVTYLSKNTEDEDFEAYSYKRVDDDYEFYDGDGNIVVSLRAAKVTKVVRVEE